MEKEKVLEIEITKINDNWSAWYIKKINRKILKNGIKDKFYINNNNYHFEITEGDTDFYYTVNLSLQETPILNLNYRDEEIIPNLIENNQVNDLVLIMTEINKKYGILKSWKPKLGESFFIVERVRTEVSFKWIVTDLVYKNDHWIDFYAINSGNCFKTYEEAEKVVLKLEDLEKNFWAKVRTGEIGGDKDVEV